MRNLKKILALALVFAMAFTFTASAADFTDAAEIGAKYVDDVNMLVELGVIAGYPDGSFGPQKNITRAEFAKMAYTIKYGSDTDGNLFAAQKSNFWDVEGNASVAWAKGYINYCANQNIVSGVGGGKFNPSGNITVAEATKMLLVILGCDPAKEGFTGANWVANVTAKAIDLGIYNGWTGDPSVLATRELVAKLMRNTIFSSVYTYSAITGAGSQMDALGQGWNDTLGEKTMGLQVVTGIVVANERYALSTNEEGETWVGNDADITVSGTIEATGIDSEESIILYEAEAEDGDMYWATIKIDRALDDDMLGAKVNVYFKADRVENNGRMNYKNIEVLGNVLVHSDTVAYTVPAIATDVYPDGDSTSENTIRPYIAFNVDGVEKQIKMSSDVAKVAKNVDAQGLEAVWNEINTYAYVIEGADIDDDGDIARAENETVVINQEDVLVNDFVEEMGMPTLSQYRFVSVDGGNTYSYMFKMVDGAQNAGYASVTSYSEAAGTIRLAGDVTGSLDLEDVVINGEVATDDVVVAYRANGKVVIEKVEAFTGSVESFTDDGVMLNGKEYFAWTENAEVYGANYATIFEYYNEERGAMQANTKYYVYNNLIMEIEADEEVAATANYAVVLRSYYDSDLDTAYVKLAFADNTEGTYKVGKLYTYSSSNLTHEKNNMAQELANNSLFGYIVSYKLREDGSVDLSSQDFKDNDKLTVIRGDYANDQAFVTEGKIDGKYSMNDATVVFALYGDPGMKQVGTSVVVDSSVCDVYENQVKVGSTYAPVKAKAYKLADLENLTANALDNNYYSDLTGVIESNEVCGSYLLNKTTGSSRYIVAAAITVGAELADGEAAYDADDNIAYVVSARQLYNNATDLYYAQVTLIDENGIKTAYTVDDVANDASVEQLNENFGIGKLTDWAGKFVKYELDAEGKIAMLDVNAYNVNLNGYTDGDASKLVPVTVTGVRGDIVSFYDIVWNNTAVENATLESAELAEDGYVIVNIDEDDYAGETLSKLAAREDTLYAGKANAVICLDKDGQIEKIFSFTAGITFERV